MIATLQQHNGPYPMDTISEFGALTLRTEPVSITKRTVAFVFSIDKSDSMNDRIRRKRKIEFVKETMTSMCEYLAKLECTVFAEINSFNNSFTTDLPLVRVNTDSLQVLLDTIRNITADHDTNIEEAFKQVNERILNHMRHMPDADIIHVFLSDGEATSGVRSTKKLQKMINTSYSNIMIGYGVEHNAALLHACAVGGKHSTYLFVNDFEQTYGVYSEILNSVLYPAVEGVTIVCEAALGTGEAALGTSEAALGTSEAALGQIYDGEKGEWKDRLFLPLLAGDVEFTYYTRGNPKLSIKYLSNEGVECSILPKSLDAGDLTPHIYRQLTQSMIFKSSDRSSRDEIHRVFKLMQAYIAEDDARNTTFMKRLCDDLFMVYQTMCDIYDGNTYRISLLNSQTRHVSYRISSLSDKTLVYGEEDADDLKYQTSNINYTQENASPCLRDIQNSIR